MSPEARSGQRVASNVFIKECQGLQKNAFLQPEATSPDTGAVVTPWRHCREAWLCSLPFTQHILRLGLRAPKEIPNSFKGFTFSSLGVLETKANASVLALKCLFLRRPMLESCALSVL